MKKILFRGLPVFNLSAFAITMFFSSQSAFAATAPSIVVTPSTVTSSLCTAVDWLFFVLIGMAVVMALVGGYLYATSEGNPEKIGKANKTLLYAAIGVVVALLAKGFPQTVAGLIGTSFTGGC